MRRRPIQLAAPALVLTLALAACEQVGPTAPSEPPRFAVQAAGGPSSLDLIEADYAAGKLDRQTVNRYRAYALFAPGRLPARYRSRGFGKDATPSMVKLARDWEALSPSTKKEVLDLEANGFGKLQETRETTHFVLHYTDSGKDGVPALDADANGTPDFIDAAMLSWETIWQREVVELGYPSPVGTPAQKFHVYYEDLSYYGYTQATSVQVIGTDPIDRATATGYIVVENDFYGFPPNDGDPTGTEIVRSGALGVTQAHEFMHAIQWAINFYQMTWLSEAQATWTEDEVYPNVNDWHGYLFSFMAWPDYPIFDRNWYGAAFFLHWITERRGTDVMRQIELATATRRGEDLIRDLGLGGSWESMREFAPDEYDLDIADFTTEPPSIIPLPTIYTRASHTTYPVSVSVPASTEDAPNRAPWGLGANFVDFVGTVSGSITVSFDGADGYAWRASVVATPRNGGSPTVTAIPLDEGSTGSITLSGFGTHWAKVTLVPTIVDLPGAEVPFAYGASVQTASAVVGSAP